MLGLGPHASFIIAAYAVAFIALGGLTLAIIADDRKQRRLLAELERQGITRRSAARGAAATPTVTRTARSDAIGTS
jgi:heme exporter protein D